MLGFIARTAATHAAVKGIRSAASSDDASENSVNRSTAHDFMSGGSGEDAAIARGNKSALMARENREAEFERQIATQEVQYQDERYAPLDSGDEFLDEVYGKLGEIDNKMGKMLAHFIAQDKREEKQADLDRQANLSRKLNKEEAGAAAGAAAATAIPGGSGTTTPMPAPSSGGGSGAPQESGGDDFSALGLAADIGINIALGKAIKAGASRFLKTNAGQNLANAAKTSKAAQAASKATKVGRTAGKFAGKAGAVVQAGVGAYQLLNAKNAAVEAAGERDMSSTFAGETAATTTGTNLDLEKMAEIGKYNSAAAETEQLAGRINGAINLVTGAAAFIPGIGQAIQGIGLLWDLFGAGLLSKPDKATLDRIGLTDEDLERAQIIMKEGGPDELKKRLFAEGMSTDDAEEAIKRAGRAIGTFYAGLGNVNAPETWPVDWTSQWFEDTLLEKIQDKQGTQYQQDLYEAALEFWQRLINDAETQFVPETTEKMEEEAKNGYPYRKKMKDWLDKNKLVIGETKPTYIGNNKPDEDVSHVFPYFGIGVQPEYKAVLNEILASHNLREVKDAGGYLYTKESPMWSRAKNEGLWFYGNSKGSTYRQFLAKPGIEPEFLAQGGVLNSATSLGMMEAEAINTLENSGNQIKNVIKDGFNGMNDEWFDDALMGYFMDSVLPGLVGALKKDKRELGIATPISVFG